ncbi:TPA: DUF551 domain-containing protein [Klebsiella pneumoniae]|nr:DUF551 domain-containing protein [Klebsiella pneumoniae]
MDSEPVALVWQHLDKLNVTIFEERARDLAWGGVNVEPLYRHPQPVPVCVPTLEEWCELTEQKPVGWVRDAMKEAYDACRAAMPAAAQHDTPALNPVQSVVTVPGKWIPVSERLPEDSGRYWCYVEEQNDLGKSHYQWNCSWNGDRWWVESEGGGIVTHWMPLPAAPQEVKGE